MLKRLLMIGVVLVALGLGAVVVLVRTMGSGAPPSVDERTVAGSDTLADRLGLPGAGPFIGLDPEPVLTEAMFETPEDYEASPAVRAVALADEAKLDEARDAVAEETNDLHAALARFHIAQAVMQASESPMAMMAGATSLREAAGTLLELKPEHYGAHQFLIFADQFTPKFVGGDPERAMARAMEGVERGDPRYVLVVAALHLAEKNQADAVSWCERALGEGVYSMRTVQGCAEWLIEQGRASEAETLVAALARESSGTAAVCDTLAKYFDAIGDAAKAEIARAAIVSDETEAGTEEEAVEEPA